jgi:hypothetical protein
MWEDLPRWYNLERHFQNVHSETTRQFVNYVVGEDMMLQLTCGVPQPSQVSVLP